MADLPDVNVWVALSAEGHTSYERAKRYWISEASGDVSFCRQTSLGLLRVIGGRYAAESRGLSVAEAWQVYVRWLNEPGVSLMSEPGGIEDLLDQWVSAGLVTQRTWTDAYLAAFSIAADMRMVTFDRDFDRFPGLDLLHLT